MGHEKAEKTFTGIAHTRYSVEKKLDNMTHIYLTVSHFYLGKLHASRQQIYLRHP